MSTLPNSTPPPSIRLWIVEDSPSYQETLVRLLGHTPDIDCLATFERGEEALAAASAAAERPDVVLMDISLPGISGVETTERLKSRWPTVEIVMLTNHDRPELVFEALRSGASGYLLKNTDVERILSAIRQAAMGAMLLPAPVARKVLGFFTDEHPATPRPPIGARRPGKDYGLSQRQREVLEEMVGGKTQKEIAEALHISPSTVNSHIQHIYKRLHVNSASAAVAKAVRECLV